VSAQVSVTAAPLTVIEPEETLNDGQIVGIAAAVNEAEVAAGKLALSRATTTSVRQFAEHMVTAHTSIDRQLLSLAGSEGIELKESNVCKKLKNETATEDDTLASMSGAQFDRAYVTAQLKGHEDVLALLDTKLLPSAHSAALKAVLLETRTKVVEHIRMAKEAQASMGM
jgi:putative membrane protein